MAVFSAAFFYHVAYYVVQLNRVRRSPSLLPDLPGEVFEYEAVPEPSMIPAGILAGLGMAGVKLARRRRQRAIAFSLQFASSKPASESVDQA